jgi:hypothetical protein
MTARAILDEAAAVLEARGKSYGDAAAAFAAIAERWSATLGRPVTPAEVVLCMIDLKLARLARDPGYHDGVIDVIGYAALLPEVTR